MSRPVPELVSEWLCFGGHQVVLAHDSETTGTRMEFSLFLPPQAAYRAVPMVLYLSGLTCTWENATTKAGFQRIASELGLAVVCPDTSPRGAGVPNDEASDLGQGAGFYVNATQSPWAANFRMYDYVTKELLAVLAEHAPVQTERVAIMGHSMGGHGALVAGLREPQRFISVSAFSPIVAPSEVPWGQKAFAAYLGSDPEVWAEYDACQLVRKAVHPAMIRIDQGLADRFLPTQLQLHRFEAAAREAGQRCDVRRHEGYDHSYYFVSTFIEEHLRIHAAAFDHGR